MFPGYVQSNMSVNMNKGPAEVNITFLKVATKRTTRESARPHVVDGMSFVCYIVILIQATTVIDIQLPMCPTHRRIIGISLC